MGTKEDDVRNSTDKLVALTRIKRDLGRPPVIVVSWGTRSKFGFPFTGIVTSLRQNFTLFSSDGKPLRATLSLSIKEFLDWKEDELETDPEFTTRLVKRGDTLSSIAKHVYRDPGLWRVIAETNKIDDPRRLTVGARLAIPKLD
jgi:nucleoid-associated protein YgaU